MSGNICASWGVVMMVVWILSKQTKTVARLQRRSVRVCLRLVPASCACIYMMRAPALRPGSPSKGGSRECGAGIHGSKVVSTPWLLVSGFWKCWARAAAVSGRKRGGGRHCSTARVSNEREEGRRGPPRCAYAAPIAAPIAVPINPLPVCVFYNDHREAAGKTREWRRQGRPGGRGDLEVFRPKCRLYVSRQ